MAYVGYKDGETSNMNEVEVNLRFQTSSGTHPDAAVGQAVSDVTNSSGVYSIVLKEGYSFTTCITCHVGVQGDVDKAAQFTSWTPATRTLVVTVTDDTQTGDWAAAEPADDVWIHVRAVFCKRSAQAPSVSI